MSLSGERGTLTASRFVQQSRAKDETALKCRRGAVWLQVSRASAFQLR